MPGWWNVFLVLCGVGGGVMLLIGMFSPVDDALDLSPVGFEQASPTPSSGLEPLPVPTGEDPVPTSGEEPPDGGDVPPEAREVAENAFWAMYSTEKAELTPMAGGGTAPPPAKEFPDATVTEMTVISVEADEIVFTAFGDADGAGTAFGPALRTIHVVNEGGQWRVAAD